MKIAKERTATIVLILFTILSAVQRVVMYNVPNAAPSFAFLCISNLIGFLALFLVKTAKRKRIVGSAVKKGFLLALLLFFFNFFLMLGIRGGSLVTVSSVVSLFFVFVTPILLLLRKRVTYFSFIAMLVAIVALALMMGDKIEYLLGSIYVSYIILADLFMAAYMVSVSVLGENEDPFAMTVSMTGFLTVFCFVGWLVECHMKGVPFELPKTGLFWIFAVLAGILMRAVFSYGQIWAQQTVTPLQASLLVSGQVVVALIMNPIICTRLGLEYVPATFFQWAGVLLLISAAFMVDERYMARLGYEEIHTIESPMTEKRSSVSKKIVLYTLTFALIAAIASILFYFFALKYVHSAVNKEIGGVETAWGVLEDAINRLFAVVFEVGMLLVGLVLVVVTLLTGKLSRRISDPIRQLETDVQKISDGDLSIRTQVHTNDEIGSLADSFNSMADSLQQHIEEMKEITAKEERMAGELFAAKTIQASMLPQDFDQFSEGRDFTLYAMMDPAKEVGGDLYDYFMVDEDHLCLVIADVSGKGIPASLFMVVTKILIKLRTKLGGSPAEVLADVNARLCENNGGELFVTVWLTMIELSTGKAISSNAGHEHPLIRRGRDGAFEISKYRHSPAVAIMEGMKFSEHEFLLEPGDCLFVYTDGVPEATNLQDEMFGEERLTDALNQDPDAPVKDLLIRVKDEIDRFVGDAVQFDDITMLGFEYR